MDFKFGNSNIEDIDFSWHVGQTINKSYMLQIPALKNIYSV